jgi:phosphomannomutase
VVNGDAVLLLAARDMQSRGALANATVVATTMSNMGLELALKRSGIRMLRANVGDKYVLEEMQRVGATLGGEQSGHILFRDGDATTGDGLLTALRVMEIMVGRGQAAGRSGERSEGVSADDSECAGAGRLRSRRFLRCKRRLRRLRGNSTATAAWWCATPAPKRWRG